MSDLSVAVDAVTHGKLAHEHSHTVVVGVDGSGDSTNALRWAADFAASAGAKLRVVTVWHLPTALGWAMPPTPEGVPERHASKVLEEAVDEVFGPDRPADLELKAVEGHAAAVLLKESKDADLLVVGSRGLGSFAAAMLGSVGNHCAKHADCPVVIVRK